MFLSREYRKLLTMQYWSMIRYFNFLGKANQVIPRVLSLRNWEIKIILKSNSSTLSTTARIIYLIIIRMNVLLHLLEFKSVVFFVWTTNYDLVIFYSQSRKEKNGRGDQFFFFFN